MNVSNVLLLPFQKKVAFRHGPLDTRHRSVHCCIWRNVRGRAVNH